MADKIKDLTCEKMSNMKKKKKETKKRHANKGSIKK